MRRAHNPKASRSSKVKEQLKPRGSSVQGRGLGRPLQLLPVPLHRLKGAIVPLRLEVENYLIESTVEGNTREVTPWGVPVIWNSKAHLLNSERRGRATHSKLDEAAVGKQPSHAQVAGPQAFYAGYAR